MLVMLGCEREWIKEATTTEDNAPYVKITVPTRTQMTSTPV